MALVNWNPVAAANFSESNALRLAAQQQLAGGIKGIGDTAVAFNDATGKANTDILLNSLVGQRTPEAAMAAIQAAKAQAGGMYNNYDQAAFRSAAEALPKSAADAQELDLQIADKPYLQAAALAYSRGDREAVGNFAKEVRSNAGRAELSKLIGDSHTMAVQDAGVVNAEGKLAEEIRNNKQQNKIDWFEARKKSTGDNVFGRQVLTAQQSLQALKDRYAKEDLTATTGTVADREALQATINGKDGAALDSWGNGTPKNMHKVLMETSPAYAGAGAKKQNSVLKALIQENTTQTGGGWWDSMVNRDLTDEQITTRGSVILGEVTTETDTLRKQEVTSEQAKSLAKLRGELTLKGDPAANAPDEVLYEVLYPGWNERQRQASAGTPPPKPKEDPKAAEQYLKDKAELAAREAKRQAELAAGKGSPKPVKGGVVLPSRHPVGINAPKDPTQGSSPTAQAIISGVKSASKAIADTSKAKPNTEMLQGGGKGFLGRSVVPVNTDGLTTVAKGVGKLATTSVPEAILAIDAYNAKPVNTPIPTKPIDVPKAAAKVVAAVKTAPSNISAVTDVFAQVAAAEAKAKVPTPIAKSVSVTPPPVVIPVETNQVGIEQALPPDLVREAPAATVLKSSVKQTKTGSAPIATTTTSVPEAASKIVASNTSKPSNTSFLDNNFTLVAAAQAKAKVPTPVTPAVIKTTVRQDVKGTTPIAKSSQSGTWETMFKKVADKANEVISGKGWSNDPKNQDQYDNGLVVDGESTQPSPKHEISIMGMWDKNNNVRSQFLGDYDTFKGYAVNVKVKGGEEYMIPLTYDEIATHTGASREDILSASTNDIRSNAVVQRRVYRTALDKLNTQLSNSKGK